MGKGKGKGEGNGNGNGNRNGNRRFLAALGMTKGSGEMCGLTGGAFHLIGGRVR